MQICIDPLGPGGIDENLHRSSQGRKDGCKFASIPQALGGWMKICINPSALRGSLQICIDPPSPGGMDANLHPNLHRSPKPWGDQ